jgi:hypothetical protein
MTEEMEQKLVARLNSALAEAKYWKEEVEDLERHNKRHRSKIEELRDCIRERNGDRSVFRGVIGEEERFYGYIRGLHYEHAEEGKEGSLRAVFEYAYEVTIWEVPDMELFSILHGHLYEMANELKENGNWGYSKLWIKKENGRWSATLP